jgi:beta-N-acetylhexosaminidase
MIKHVPGHGRAMADSHKELPCVDLPREQLELTDFAPFKGLADMPLAMTAHILFPQIDAERPATTSPTIIKEIVRGYIGFEGLIVSDDVTMAALSGGNREKAKATRSAGCDIVLHCYAELAQMREIALGSGQVSDESFARFDKAKAAVATSPEEIDAAALQAELTSLLQG